MENTQFIFFFLLLRNWSERKGNNETLSSHHLEQGGIKTFQEQNKTQVRTQSTAITLGCSAKIGALIKYIHSAY